MLIRDGFGERLKQERARLNYSQREFSELAGISQNTQRAYENGKNTVSVGYLETAESLGINAMYVLSGRLEQDNCLAPDEFRLVTSYRGLSKRKQQKLQRIAAEQ